MDPSRLNLRIEPDWLAIERVHAESVAFLKRRGLATDAVDAVSMVACELAENAMKYGRFIDDTAGIDVSVTHGSAAVTVEVRSPAGTDEAVGRLEYMVQWIRGFQDPFEAYLERLKEVSAQNMGTPESGLGLVRIAYEGHSILDFFVDAENVLTVSAVYPLETATGAHP